MSGDGQGDIALEEVGEAGVVSWHEDIQVLADLASQGDALADQVAAMPGQELELVVGRIGGGLGRPKPLTAARWMAREVGVVGLVAGVGGLAELLGGERMDDADLEAAAAKARLTGW